LLFAVKSDSDVSTNVGQQGDQAENVVKEVVVSSAAASNNTVNDQSNDPPSLYADLADAVELVNEVVVLHANIEQTGQNDVPSCDQVSTNNTIGARSFYGKRMKTGVGLQPSRKKYRPARYND
jgi:hypothetical protein